jgi:predicted RNA methylase
MLDNLSASHSRFVLAVFDDLLNKRKRNKVWYEKLARENGITDKNNVKELTELAVSLRARELAQQPFTTERTRFAMLVDLYESQVNLSHRTSHSILLQQYSTPAPISFLAGLFCNAASAHSVFEPSAGNGLLCHTAPYKHTTVNEIDSVRHSHLLAQPYRKVIQQDATKPFSGFEKQFEAVLTNPPFGQLRQAVKINGYLFTALEHVMSVRTLECMKDDGRAAIIVGGFARYDDKRRLTGSNRVFLNYLYSHFDVRDIINISGRDLFSRQGTGFNVRLILIDGRKSTPGGSAPTFNAEKETVVSNYEELWRRVIQAKAQCVTSGSWEFSFKDWFTARSGIGEFTAADFEQMQEYHFKAVSARLKSGKYVALDALADYPELAAQLIPAAQPDKKQAAPVNFPELSGVGSSGNYRITLCSLQNPQRRYAFHGSFADQKDAQLFARQLTGFLSREEHPLDCEIESVELLSGALGAPYIPTSEGCTVLDTVVPDSMSFGTHDALAKIREAVGGDIDEFVRDRLDYASNVDLCRALAAEQIDAVAMAIYNVEARRKGNLGMGMIVGDQTGIGKGRIAAAMIRYATKRGLCPIFLTEKPNLFTDLYRDLKAIGSEHLVPFIINTKDVKSTILDEFGKKLYAPLDQQQQKKIFESGELPPGYDFIMATYTQFNNPKRPAKQDFVTPLAEQNVLVMDEAHNASGTGNTGQFLQQILAQSEGVLYLSATFAKQPENMPLYALKTVLSEASLSSEDLAKAIVRGGVALQELIAAEMVNEGQMLRRERSYEGVEVNYITLEESSDLHRATSDAVTDIVREIILFQKIFVQPEIDRMDTEYSESQMIVKSRGGTERAGIDNKPYYSKVFQLISQMLFSIKAEAVAERAIERLREGKKPVIAFASTMESFVESAAEEQGQIMQPGSVINADFSEVLRRGLAGVMRYTILDGAGGYSFEQFEPSSLGEQAEAEFKRIMKKIEQASFGISISPIDVILNRIRSAGFSAAEVTGRTYELELYNSYGEVGRIEKNIQNPGKLKGKIKLRKKLVTNEAFRLFNENKIDCLLINQSGSTGASAHAIPTNSVPPEQVKQRVMLILQPELNIATEVQKRGRINRTGQLYKPIYDYITSNIPAEQRLMMMLQSKLKSLDANTTSNQKQSKGILDVPDFLNKYGGEVVQDYLEDNPEIDELLDYPIGNMQSVSEMASKVSGRVAVLPTKMQQEFYEEITERYNALVEYLKQTGEYNLEMQRYELEASTIEKTVLQAGKGGTSVFGTDSYLEHCEVNVLRKPYRYDELNTLLNQSLDGKSPIEHQKNFLAGVKTYYEQELERRSSELESAHNEYMTETTKQIEELQAAEIEETPVVEEQIIENAEPEEDDDFTDEVEQKVKPRKLSPVERAKKMMEAKQDDYLKKLTKLTDQFTSNLNYLQDAATVLTIGCRVVFIHTREIDAANGESSAAIAESRHNAIFLGFRVDTKRKKAYSLSNIVLRFAIASGLKYVAIPASKIKNIQSIVTQSRTIAAERDFDIEAYWNESVSKTLKNREMRYIVTGNVLQALGTLTNGLLVRFSAQNGDERIGVFMPEDWQPPQEKNGDRLIEVPALRAFELIRKLPVGKQISIGRRITLFREATNYKMVVGTSKNLGGDIYSNERLLKLAEGNNFNKTSSVMVAKFRPEDLANVLTIIQEDFNETVKVTEDEFELVGKGVTNESAVSRFPKLNPHSEKKHNAIDNNYELLELEAEALALSLELELELMAA